MTEPTQKKIRICPFISGPILINGEVKFAPIECVINSPKYECPLGINTFCSPKSAAINIAKIADPKSETIQTGMAILREVMRFNQGIDEEVEQDAGKSDGTTAK